MPCRSSVLRPYLVRREQMSVDPRPAATGLRARRREVAALLRARLPEVAEQTVARRHREVPATPARSPARCGANIERAVQMALGGFLRLAGQSRDGGPEHAAAAGADGRLRARPRRGPQRPDDGRPARRLPGRRAGRVARAVGDRWSSDGLPAADHGASSPSWSSPTSTSCRRPASPGTPTSSRRPGGCASATSSGSAQRLLERRRPRTSWSPPRSGRGGRRRAR